jgi:hypothetical protein
MVETIFMALLATSIAIPIAFVLSFLAAHNLMKPVRLTLGNMLVSFIALPVGWWIGVVVLGGLGSFGVEVGRGDVALALGGFLIPIAAIVGGGMLVRYIASRFAYPVGSWEAQATGVANQLIVIVLVVFIVGSIGGLGILGGDQFKSLGDTIRPDDRGTVFLWFQRALADGIGGIGQLIGILGEMVELFIGGVAGVLGAFTLSGIVTTATRKPLLHLPQVPSVVVGSVLGAISGGLLLAGCGRDWSWCGAARSAGTPDDSASRRADYGDDPAAGVPHHPQSGWKPHQHRCPRQPGGVYCHCGM